MSKLDQSSPAITVAGIGWFRAERYDEARAAMADAENLPATYTRWLHRAQIMERAMRRHVRTIIRVPVDEGAFQAYCLAHGIAPDVIARKRYAQEKAMTRWLTDARRGRDPVGSRASAAPERLERVA